MTITVTKRRVLAGLAIVALATAGVLWLARQALTGFAVNSLLHLAGASGVSFTVTEATPWKVQVEDISFQVRERVFGAKRLSFVRPHWWSPTLGAVRVEQATVPLALDRLTMSATPDQPKEPAATKPARLPLQEFSLDGRLVVSAGALPAQALALTLTAHMNERDILVGKVHADGPGLAIQGEVDFNPANREVAFRVPAVNIDVKNWQAFVEQLLDLPASEWTADGKLTGSAEGKWAEDKLAGTARVQLRNGQTGNTAKAITVTGIDADLEISDLARFTTKPATLRVQELRTGQLVLRDMHYEFHFEGANEVAVSKATFLALGGTVAAEPFRYRFDRRILDAVILVDGINVEEVMALTPDLPANAKGRVNGSVPLRIDSTGLHLGTGWLELKPGSYAEIQLKAQGLLTGGASPTSPSYAVLSKIESGLLTLQVSEMRLDIRPPNAPEGRSAQLHIAGAPVDPQVKAPVVLDLNVNGPLERLINLGLDSRVSFGAKP
jgi:hypothetical protein